MSELEAQIEFIKAKIKLIRKKKGWTQEQLAKEAGVERKTITRLETKGEMTLKNICKVCIALGLLIDLVNMEEWYDTSNLWYVY